MVIYGDFVVVGDRTDNITTRKYSQDTELLWSVDHGATVRSVAIDPADGSIVTVGDRAGTITTRKYASDGTPIWDADHGATVRSVAIDPADGSIVTVGDSVNSVTTRKYASDGTPIWTANHVATAFGVAISPIDSSVVTVGDRFNFSICMRRYTSSGTESWTYDHGQTLYSAAFSTDGNKIFVGGLNSGDIRIRVLDNSGNVIDSVSPGATPVNMEISNEAGNDYIVIPSNSGTDNNTIRKLEQNGTLVWAKDAGAERIDAAVDPTDNSIIVVGRTSQYNSWLAVHKYSSDGETILWTIVLNEGDTVNTWRYRGVAIDTREKEFSLATPTNLQTVASGGNRALVSWDWAE